MFTVSVWILKMELKQALNEFNWGRCPHNKKSLSFSQPGKFWICTTFHPRLMILIINSSAWPTTRDAASLKSENLPPKLADLLWVWFFLCLTSFSWVLDFANQALLTALSSYWLDVPKSGPWLIERLWKRMSESYSNLILLF